MITRKSIREKASDLLRQCKVTQPPVDVEFIARGLRIVLRRVGFAKDVSGLLARKGDMVLLGVNRTDSPTRQRFSIAHEIGHFVLHEPKPIFVDGVTLRFRNSKSSQGDDREEIEANAFAAELLMPEEFVRRDMAELGNVIDENEIGDLAKRYGVSLQAFVYRLTNLGYIDM